MERRLRRNRLRNTQPEAAPLPQEDRRQLHIGRLMPNMVTILALCFGLSAMRYALDARWELSVSFIVIAALLDALDGRLARLLNATSDFGAHLDSLVDFLNFGVAPAFVLYMFSMHEIRAFGWGIALFYSICCVIRLARFNTTLEEDDPPFWMDYFFSGIPSPAGALLALTPLLVDFALRNEIPGNYGEIIWPFFTPLTNCLFVATVGVLMASRLPTVSLKKTTIPRAIASLVLVMAAAFLIFAFTKPWTALLVLLFVYLCTIPYGLIRFQQLKAAYLKKNS